jgi:catechol 2,3-dioxygenase-like lactoylglutathione lyase family enzyme
MGGTMIKFILPLIVVEDISASRRFYEDCLEQKVLHDFGEDVQFEGGFTIHQRAHFQTLLGDESRYPITLKSNSGELYFEAENLYAAQERLKLVGVNFIHEVEEQPWGQLVMRLYDPDGHMIEIGERMESTVLRLYEQGRSLEAIMKKTGMAKEFVEGTLK